MSSGKFHHRKGSNSRHQAVITCHITKASHKELAHSSHRAKFWVLVWGKTYHRGAWHDWGWYDQGGVWWVEAPFIT